jgi:hypothetical protein
MQSKLIFPEVRESPTRAGAWVRKGNMYEREKCLTHAGAWVKRGSEIKCGIMYERERNVSPTLERG